MFLCRRRYVPYVGNMFLCRRRYVLWCHRSDSRQIHVPPKKEKGAERTAENSSPAPYTNRERPQSLHLHYRSEVAPVIGLRIELLSTLGHIERSRPYTAKHGVVHLKRALNVGIHRRNAVAIQEGTLLDARNAAWDADGLQTRAQVASMLTNLLHTLWKGNRRESRAIIEGTVADGIHAARNVDWLQTSATTERRHSDFRHAAWETDGRRPSVLPDFCSNHR